MARYLTKPEHAVILLMDVVDDLTDVVGVLEEEEDTKQLDQLIDDASVLTDRLRELFGVEV